MAVKALGEVKPSSTTTGLRATNNQTVPATAYPAQAVQFQVLSTNTGAIYICDRATPTLTAHVLYQIPPPSAGPPVYYPGWTAGNPAGAQPINVADFWIVPAVANEGVRVTVVR